MAEQKSLNIKSGGKAVRLPNKKNTFLMKGRRHEDGGIKIGNENGLEVENDEIVNIDKNNNVKVLSSVQFLNGESPAEKVLKGANINKTFNQQENFKDRNNINDDGSMNKTIKGRNRLGKFIQVENGSEHYYAIPPVRGGEQGISTRRAKYGLTTKSKYRNLVNIDNTDEDIELPSDAIKKWAEEKTGYTEPETVKPPLLARGQKPFTATLNNETKTEPNIKRENLLKNPDVVKDVVSIGSNLLGSLISTGINSRALSNMKAPEKPVLTEPSKLKTRINVHPQLASINETERSIIKDIDKNTASSNVGLQRKQTVKNSSLLQKLGLFGNKENIETELINKDALNQQAVRMANDNKIDQYNLTKTNFDNTITEQKAANKVGFINSINRLVQGFIGRKDKQEVDEQTLKGILAGNPNVNPRILKNMGIKGITDEMIINWENINKNKTIK